MPLSNNCIWANCGAQNTTDAPERKRPDLHTSVDARRARSLKRGLSAKPASSRRRCDRQSWPAHSRRRRFKRVGVRDRKHPDSSAKAYASALAAWSAAGQKPRAPSNDGHADIWEPDGIDSLSLSPAYATLEVGIHPHRCPSFGSGGPKAALLPRSPSKMSLPQRAPCPPYGLLTICGTHVRRATHVAAGLHAHVGRRMLLRRPFACCNMVLTVLRKAQTHTLTNQAKAEDDKSRSAPIRIGDPRCNIVARTCTIERKPQASAKNNDERPCQLRPGP